MSDWSFYLSNPHWRATYVRGLRPMNGIALPKCQQGSPGGNSPMYIHSDIHSSIQVTSNPYSQSPYKVGLSNFSPLVTPNLRSQVTTCSDKSYDPGACIIGSVRQVYNDEAHM